MTPFSQDEEARYLLGTVRDFNGQYQSGQIPEAFESFAALVRLLLQLTILSDVGTVKLHGARDATPVVSGWTIGDPLPLRNGNYLRMHISLYIDATPEGPRLKVKKASYQYQLDEGGDRWVFRYDYLRQSGAPHPPAHINVRASLVEPDCLPVDFPLSRVHFPTGRFSFEAITRLLVKDFSVGSNRPEALWSPLFQESEKAFYQIAHFPLG